MAIAAGRGCIAGLHGGRRSIIKGHDGNESRLLLQGLLVVYIREMATRFTRFGLQRSGGIIIVTERRELLN